MAASDHVNPNQLRLFMTPREIMSEYEPASGDYMVGEDTRDVWKRKEREARISGMTRSIREKGVQVPVSLHPDWNEIMGGHHRIAAAYSVDPDSVIPVTYDESSWDATDTEEDTIRRHNLRDLPDTEHVRRDNGSGSF